MNKNKTINSICCCGKYFSENGDHILVIFPCEHLIHLKCIKRSSNCKCPFSYCKQKITKVLTFYEIKNKVKNNKEIQFYQIYVDMLTVLNMKKSNGVSFSKLAIRSPIIARSVGKAFSVKSANDLHNTAHEICTNHNINIKVINKHKINKGKKIIIANHSNYLDSFIIYNVFKSGFLSSAVIKDPWYIRNLVRNIPILIVKRGQQNNTVTQMKNYINKNGDLCLFPEGIMTHPNTIGLFRTGAFYTGYPVQPVVIKFKPNIYDGDYVAFCLKFFSLEKIDVEVIVLDIEYPPFTKEKIENVKHKMAKAGGLAISRVSNRDVKD